MPLTGSTSRVPAEWVREQVEAYEGSGGARADALARHRSAIIVMTDAGAPHRQAPEVAGHAGGARG